MKIHLGNIIQQVYEQKGLKLKYFSSQIGMTERNFYKIIEKENINTDLLFKISTVLNYNFFKLLSDEMSKELGEIPTVNEPLEPYQTKKEKPIELSLNIHFNDEKKRNEVLKLLFENNIPDVLSNNI